jgi:hypothetical protein
MPCSFEPNRILVYLIASQEKQRILVNRFEWMQKHLLKRSAEQFLGQTHIGYNPTNKTTNIGKIPKDSNPPKIP